MYITIILYVPHHIYLHTCSYIDIYVLYRPSNDITTLGSQRIEAVVIYAKRGHVEIISFQRLDNSILYAFIIIYLLIIIIIIIII